MKILVIFYIDTVLDGGQKHLIPYPPNVGDFVEIDKNVYIVDSRIFVYESGSAPLVKIYLKAL